jgi:hypothetical protein
MSVVRHDREDLSELAERARAAWNDLSVPAPQDHWVDPDDDSSIVSWFFVHRLDERGW